MNHEQPSTRRTTSPGLLHEIMTRRKAVQMLGALGLSSVALPAAGSTVLASGAHQATAAASPAPGPRDDGTMLWKVQVGGMDMDNGIDFHAFFPKEITVNAGDGILFEFAPMGRPQFHTVTFTSGGELPPLFEPDLVDGTPVVTEAGVPQLRFNPELAWPDGRQDYDGTGIVNSGIDVLRAPDAAPYIVNFTTPGTYAYVCIIHSAVMQGTVIVQEAGSELPHDQAAYDAMAAEEMDAYRGQGIEAVAALEAMTATPSADGPTTWDVAVGAGGLTSARVMRFVPEVLTIKAGDTVRWTNRSDGEPHTVTFLGGVEPPQDVIIEPQESGQPKILQNMETFLPAGGSEFDSTQYINSGFNGLPPELNEMFGLVGQTYELTFNEPGDFPYYCILHSSGPEAEGPMEMNGRIIVEP